MGAVVASIEAINRAIWELVTTPAKKNFFYSMICE